MRTWFSCFTSCCQAPHRNEAKEDTPLVVAVIAKDVAAPVTEVSPCKDDTGVHVSQTVQELFQLGDVMRACSGIPGSSYHQLGRICGILAEHFALSYVSASVLSSTGITYLPIVAGGRLARVCPLGLPQFLDAAHASSFYHVAGQKRFLSRRVPGDELPPDWEQLREASGLAAFLAAAITVGSETVAVLTMADEDPDKFASPMWQTSLDLIGAFIGHLFRDRLLVGYCAVVEELMVVDSLDDLIRTLSRCVVRLQSEKLQQMRLSCRIACIASDTSSAIIFDEGLPYASVLASGTDDLASPAHMPSRQGAAAAFARLSHTPSTQDGNGPSASEPQLGHVGAPGMGAHTPRGRLGRQSMVTPSPSTDPYIAALMMQYQVQMHSTANLVPDPVDSGLQPALRLPSQAQAHPGGGGGVPLYSANNNPLLPHARMQSAAGALGGGGGGAAGASSGGAGGSGGGVMGSSLGAATPPGPPPPPMGRFGGGGSCISQHGQCGGSLTGDAAREMGLWCGLDPGIASNFSQQQLQVEGQTYLVDNTLLAEAIANRACVWIGDCVAFMQNPSNPNADVFLAATTHHTTAMLLAVMWERGSGSGGGGSSAAGPGAAAARLSNRHQQTHPHLRALARMGPGEVSQGPGCANDVPSTSTVLSVGTAQAAVLGAFGSTFARPSPQQTAAIAAEVARMLPVTSTTSTASNINNVNNINKDNINHSDLPKLPRGLGAGDHASGQLGEPKSPSALLASMAAAGSSSVPGGRTCDLPLLAFYLLTSGAASPSVLQELLVGLRELLVVLEPLVSSKLSDELSEEWVQLQREVLDKTKILKQPRDRTIVLRNTAAQLGGVLNSHCSVDDCGVSSIVSESPLRPPSPRACQVSSCTATGAVTPASASVGAPGGGAGGGIRTVDALLSMSERALSVGNGGGATASGGLCATPRPRNPSFLMSRSFTGKRISALISGVQDRVQQAQRMSVSYNTMFSRPDDLRSITMLEKLGSGGFGTVYLGMYQSTEVAVKVIVERDSGDTEVLRNAVELAVLSTLSHPNIVQVLTFFTDVTVQIPPVQARLSGAAPPIYLLPHEPSPVQLDLTPVTSTAVDSTAIGPEGLSGGGGASRGGQSGPDSNNSGGALGAIAAAAGAQANPRPPTQKQPPLPGQPPKKALLILMEFCDAGCMADAIRNGVFREKVKGGYGAPQPAWSHIYLTLLEVALALRYLHSINLVHRDVKPQNVLLKSSPSDVRGFTAKLSDFGLVKLLTEADMMASNAAPAAPTSRRPRQYSGTVSHVAPEAIHNGSATTVDVAVDVYAFGIVMWEILTGQPVYLGLNSDQIIDRVQNDGMRPAFPVDAPTEYVTLANRCLDADPRQRPNSEEVVQQLSALSSATRCSKVLAARRRLSTFSNKELLRNVANAKLAAANAAAAAQGGPPYNHHGGGGGGGGARHSQRQHNEDDFPLHIL